VTSHATSAADPAAPSDGAATGAPSGAPLLSVEGLRVEFPTRSAGFGRSEPFVAVRDASLTLRRGETLGIVGESGSGKTTLGRAVLRLIEPAAGRVLFEGDDLAHASGRALRAARARMQMIFQDPAASLNPRMRIAEAVAEPLEIHARGGTRAQRRRIVADLLDRCGMPADSMARFPHEFSGGQRQRIAIARALALEPSLIVCDEPTSALDVSVQAQIINLLQDLQDDLGLAYLFISHDMAVVSHVCHRVAVMRAGEIVETGETDRVVECPRHAYTRELLSAVPRMR
jgi:ABC-type microcin C transport system duplicated ATPase subunit YejF